MNTLATVAVALGSAGVVALMGRGADGGGGLGFDELLEDPLQRGADGVGHLACLEGGEQFGKVRLGEGHRRSPLRDPGKEHVETHAGGPPCGGPCYADLHHVTGRPHDDRAVACTPPQ